MNLQMRLPKCALKSPLNNYGSHTIKDELDWTRLVKHGLVKYVFVIP